MNDKTNNYSGNEVYEEGTIRGLIAATEQGDVLSRIEHFYGPEKNEQFKQLYELLLTLPVEKNKNEMTLYIWVFERIGERGCRRIEDYNEQDDTHRPDELYFDVYALDEFYDDDIVYSICATKYRKFLGFYFSEYTFANFTKESMLAHFLWALCRDDFDERRANPC